jgi:3-hydroxyisobutyrate dehydrogenase
MSTGGLPENAVVWWLGLGQMGAALSARAAKGAHVVGIDPRGSVGKACPFETVRSLQDLDATQPAPWAVVLCLPTPDAYLSSVRELAISPRLESTAAIINLSTVGIEAAAQAEALLATDKPDLDYVESLVTGGVCRATAGDVTLLVGSRKPLSQGVEALLQRLASRLHILDSIREAGIAKLVNNLAMLGIASVTVEAIDLGIKSGLDRETVFRVLRDGTGASYILNNSLTRSLIDGDFRTGFAARLALKDIGLAVHIAKQVSCDTPHADIVCGELLRAVTVGQPDETFARIATVRGL